MGPSGAVHDFVASVLCGQPASAALRRRALDAPTPTWNRVLGFEGCAPQLDRKLREQPVIDEAPAELRAALRAATAAALRFGLMTHAQLAEIATLAHAAGVRVMALKGAAQLAAGQLPGLRSISDIDLLVMPDDAARFHDLLCTTLRYRAAGRSYAHHLPTLERAGSLSIDLHVQLADAPGALDRTIWNDTRTVMAGQHPMELPSSTNMVLHVLEHGLLLNWMGRYRLRDVLDVASLYTAAVSDDVVRSYVAHSAARRACETLLSAAHAIEPRVPFTRPGAWRTIRRVARGRLALAALPTDPRVAERAFRYGGLLAEGSLSSMVRATRAAASRVAAACAHAIAHA
jgi:hypothetical protein